MLVLSKSKHTRYLTSLFIHWFSFLSLPHFTTIFAVILTDKIKLLAQPADYPCKERAHPFRVSTCTVSAAPLFSAWWRGNFSWGTWFAFSHIGTYRDRDSHHLIPHLTYSSALFPCSHSCLGKKKGCRRELNVGRETTGNLRQCWGQAGGVRKASVRLWPQIATVSHPSVLSLQLPADPLTDPCRSVCQHLLRSRNCDNEKNWWSL